VRAPIREADAYFAVKVRTTRYRSLTAYDGGMLRKLLLLSIAAAICLNSQANTETFLLTIFLRHDQSKNLDQINNATGKFRENFPPKGIEVVSWYVMMGIGQVVTLRVPPSRLREVNRTIETGAWGGYRTEFYPTYDYKPIWQSDWPSGKPAQR
jgi:hypothetical protein